MSALPSPLVPPEVDLRDFTFMPVDIGRLFGSEFHARSDDGAWRAGVTLWLKSYHQVPAASIPDDDLAQARLAEFGRDVASWREVKDAALRGWVKCSDGRLYHSVVAEKALEGWIEKLSQRKSSAAGNAKRYGQTFDPAPFDAAIETSLDNLAKLNPSSRFVAKRFPKTSHKPPVGNPEPPVGSPIGSHYGAPSGSQGNRTDLKGQVKNPSPAPARERTGASEQQTAQQIADRKLETECRRLAVGLPVEVDVNFVPVFKLLDEGLTSEDVIAGMHAIAEKNHPLRNWSGVGGWARKAAKDRLERALPPANYARAGPAPNGRAPGSAALTARSQAIKELLGEHQPSSEK